METPWFHGTEEHFAQFDASHLGSRQGKGSPGFWFSASETAAGYYGPNVVQCTLKLDHALVVSEEMFERMQKGPK